MATIALNWELGSDYGHIARFLPIAQTLRERGHRPMMVLRDISRADEMLSPYGLEYLQAPLWIPPVNGLPPPVNFTESLFLFGFLSPSGLLSIARAWRQLWRLIKPDLMIFDHAPTALLAARGLGIPRLITGNSFAVPPRIKPLPAYRWWDKTQPAARMADTEARLLATANPVLAALGAPAMREVHDLYEAEATLITATPTLDVYQGRPAAHCIGAINAIAHGASPVWPGTRSKKIFAYLKPHYPLFEPVVKAMARAEASVLIFAPGISRQLMQKLQSAHVAFSERPLVMTEVRAQCTLAVCHAGGMVDVMLNAGVPLLLLPLQMEQTMTSKRVEQSGCGLTFLPDYPPTMLDKHLGKLLSDPVFAQCATRYAVSHAALSQDHSLARLISACETLLSASAQNNAASVV
jgi:UDP:flavonoid glycosyltransferase YjiC (YdhE family)